MSEHKETDDRASERVISSEQTDDNERYFEEHRATLVSLEIDHSRSFDRQLLALSSGTIGLSILYLANVEYGINGGVSFLLYTSWIFLFISITSVLVAYRLAIRDCAKRREAWDRSYSQDETLTEHNTGLSIVVSRLNWVSLSTFVLGALALIMFVVLTFNQSQEGFGHEKRKQVSGQQEIIKRDAGKKESTFEELRKEEGREEKNHEEKADKEDNWKKETGGDGSPSSP